MKNDIELLREKSKQYFDQQLKKALPKIKFELDKNNPPLIYGAGVVGQAVCRTLRERKGVKIDVVVDGNRELWGNNFGSAKIISPNEAKDKHGNAQIIVASVIYETEIVKELERLGFSKILPMSYLNYLYSDLFDYRDYHTRYESLFQAKARSKIAELREMLADEKSKWVLSQLITYRLSHYSGVRMDEIQSSKEQYFDEDVISFKKDEVFVDGGAYDGDTLRKIANDEVMRNWTTYSFEPDPLNYNKLRKYAKRENLDKAVIEQEGLWKKSEKLKFFGLGTPESGIGNEDGFSSWSGDVEIDEKSTTVDDLPVVSIDEYFADKEVVPTFIKMDIEGAELEALEGAKKTIIKHRPKLAICIYHTPSDLWKIPLYIKKLNPNYKLYIRHYSREVCETVCYAI